MPTNTFLQHTNQVPQSKFKIPKFPIILRLWNCNTGLVGSLSEKEVSAINS